MSNTLFTHFPPRKHRVHEAYGAGAVGFAAIVCGQREGPTLWVVEGWQGDQVNPNGLVDFCDPQDVLVAKAANQVDALAVAEEALRSGAVSVVVVELGKEVSLTAGRRLQLAAEAGKSTGILVIPEGAGSNATETRWHCEPQFDPEDSTLQSWKLIKNKQGTLREWKVRWNAETRRVIVVSEAGE